MARLLSWNEVLPSKMKPSMHYHDTPRMESTVSYMMAQHILYWSSPHKQRVLNYIPEHLRLAVTTMLMNLTSSFRNYNGVFGWPQTKDEYNSTHADRIVIQTSLRSFVQATGHHHQEAWLVLLVWQLCPLSSPRPDLWLGRNRLIKLHFSTPTFSVSLPESGATFWRDFYAR